MTSEVCLKRGHNVPCGFRLTGGINFHMPLTVFEVEEGSLAYEAGIRLGDILVQIDGKDTENMSLDEAQKVISLAGENVQLSITTSDDPEDNYEEDPESSERIKALIAEYSDAPDDTDTEQVNETLISEASEQRETTASIDDLDDDHSKTEDLSSAQQLRSVDDSDHGELVTQSLSGAPEESISEDKLVSEEHPSNLYENVILEDETFVDVHSLPLKPPQPAPEPEKPVRKCWHPVMLDTSPPPIIEESTGDEEWPHKKTMRELRKAIAAKKVKATPEVLIFFLCNKFSVSEERQNQISV